jgi:hypothetical protein
LGQWRVAELVRKKDPDEAIGHEVVVGWSCFDLPLSRDIVIARKSEGRKGKKIRESWA